MRRSHLAAAMVGMALAALGIARGVSVTAQQRPEKHNMELVGYHDLQARSAYQPLIHKQGDRWIAYVGHHGGTSLNPLTGKQESNGTSILDVTDPKRPTISRPYSGRDRAGENRRRADGARVRRQQLPRADKSKVYLLRTFGNTAHEIWDVTNPATPAA